MEGRAAGGALRETLGDLVFRRLLQWGFSMVVLTPPIAWLTLVVPGWL